MRCRDDLGTFIEPSTHWQTDVPTGGSEPDPDDVADGIWSLIGFAFQSVCPSTVHIDELVVAEQVVAPAIGAAGVHTVNADGLGSVGDGDLPRALVPLINLHTAVASRSARGWQFLACPMDTAKLVDGQWTSGFLGSLNGYAGNLNDSFDLGALLPTHVNPVVYSRTRHQGGAAPYTFRITSATASTRPHWLRSRLTAP
jgi:hypothetical protein